MNVCFFVERLYAGGIGRVSSLIGNALSTVSGFCVHFLVYAKAEKPEIYAINSSIKKAYLLDHCVSMKKALLFYHISQKIKKYCLANNIDVLIACGDSLFIPAVLACKNCKTKLVCWNHTAPKRKGERKIDYLSRRFGAEHSDANVVLTKSAEAFYRSHFRVRNLWQIYNPIDPSIYSSSSGYSEDSKKIISVGRMSAPKDFSRLLRIAKSVLATNENWRWDLYGDGELLDQLEQEKHELGLDGLVTFKGQCQNLYQIYSHYAFIVMTSKWEGFPMALVEASANGLPMVAFDVETGPNEIVRNGVNGFLCNRKNDQEMIDSIDRLIESASKRLEMSIQSRSSSLLFSMEAIKNKWVIFLRDLVRSETERS